MRDSKSRCRHELVDCDVQRNGIIRCDLHDFSLLPFGQAATQALRR